MRIKQTPKSDPNARILKVAKDMLRKCGPDRLSVDEIRRKAEVSRAVFNAHFKSRDALIVGTLDAIFGEVEGNMRHLFGSLPPRQALVAFKKWYLSPEHRDGAVRSCPLVTFGSDLPRQSAHFRRTYQSGVKKIVGILAGSINVSRGVDERRIADGVLEATRQSFLVRMGL